MNKHRLVTKLSIEEYSVHILNLFLFNICCVKLLFKKDIVYLEEKNNLKITLTTPKISAYK